MHGPNGGEEGTMSKTEKSMKLCVNCKHCSYNVVSLEHKCFHPRQRLDLVTGKPLEPLCRQQRATDCGYSGKYWEPKEENSDV